MEKIKSNNKEITMRERKVSDLVMLDRIEGEMGKLVALVVNLCELPEEEVLAMSAADFKPYREKANSFL
ncbi:MAG: phage tail assembly protein [Mariprofundus sp.]|nr:phage tail assembly protein [Mariprofundus sp.]